MHQATKIAVDLDKESKYQLLLKQLEALVDGENDLIANMANIAAMIKDTFDFHWVGFYRVIDGELVLGPFQGPVACTRIQIPQGVCGTCVATKEIMVVDNVHEFEGHIACSALSNSEIVLPFVENGEVQWILDIDSVAFSGFDEIDRKYLDKIIRIKVTL